MTATSTTRKPSLRKKKKAKGNDTWLRRHSMGVMIAVIAVIVAIGSVLAFAFIPYAGGSEDGEWVYVPHGATPSQVKDSLKTRLGSPMGTRVYVMWKLMGNNPARTEGAYRIDRGQTALGIARRMATGRQTPVKVTFNGTRTMPMLAERIASQLQCTPEEFMDACLEVLPDRGFTRATFPAAFLPDTYEFYWSASPANVVKRLLDYRDAFWTDERKAKARALGLSKTEVATVASIIEEETAKRDERPMVARLYLNRLHKGMRLQADPTVKYAVGDFTLRRIRASISNAARPTTPIRSTACPRAPSGCRQARPWTMCSTLRIIIIYICVPRRIFRAITTLPPTMPPTRPTPAGISRSSTGVKFIDNSFFIKEIIAIFAVTTRNQHYLKDV